MRSFAAVSLPSPQQGSEFPCRAAPGNRAQGCDRKRLLRRRRADFRPRNEFFPVFSRAAGKRLGGGADRDFFDLAADEGLVLAEIGFETVGEAAGGLVIGLLVGPGSHAFGIAFGPGAQGSDGSERINVERTDS